MADAKPDAQQSDPSGTTGRISLRWRRTLLIGATALAVLGIAAAVFTALGPTPGISAPSEPPGVSAGASPSRSATTAPSAPPTGDPAVPSDKPPTTINQSAPITPGLTAEILRVEAVEGTARGPGEVAGPSLRVTVAIANSTMADAPLNTTIVSAYFGPDFTPAAELREPGGSPLPAVVRSGETVTGVYIFTVPESERRNVTIMVDYSVEVDSLVFQGDAATLMR